jgi:crossover junction endodeoxyribonuclease RusA
MTDIVGRDQDDGVIRLTLPLPPSLNAAYRSVVINGSGRVLLSRVGRRYKEDVKKLLMGRKSLGAARLAVHYTYWFKDKRKNDISNREKLLSDALEGMLFDNDCQIDVMLLERGGIDKMNPRVEVELREVEE